MYPATDSERLWVDGPVYRFVSRVLYAFAVILGVFILFSTPSIRAAHQQAELELAKEIASEHLRYCEKWGMPSGTPKYLNCVSDLVGIRERTEQRLRDEVAGEF
jgi:hypothetical protein